MNHYKNKKVHSLLNLLAYNIYANRLLSRSLSGRKKGSNYNRSHSFEPFISPNPITSFNPVQRFPKIDEKAFISQFSSVIGDVTIRNNVYVALMSAYGRMKELLFI